MQAPSQSGHVDADVDMDDRSAWEDEAGSDAGHASDASHASHASHASVAPSWVLDAPGVPERDFRLTTVYDAVAGGVRVHEARAQKWAGAPTRYLDTVLAPDEALHRSSGAPDRYEETDTYFAHEALPAGTLPDSDLVTAVHHYASQYYEARALQTAQARAAATTRARRLRAEQRAEDTRRARQEKEAAAHGKAGKRKARAAAAAAAEEEKAADSDTGAGASADGASTHAFVYAKQRLRDERSMDETALLAFGILLEEAGRQALGEHGDLLFTEEPEQDEEEPAEQEEQDGREEDARHTKAERAEKEKKKKRRVLDVQSGRVYDESSDE